MKKSVLGLWHHCILALARHVMFEKLWKIDLFVYISNNLYLLSIGSFLVY